MKIILDTHILLWTASGELFQKAPKAVSYIEDGKNTLMFSSASIWEVVIKSGLGRPDFIVNPTFLYNGLLMAGYQELPITGRHSLLVSTLPPIHKDPFDRILLAQSMYEGATLLTSDRILGQYLGSVVYVGE